MSDILQRQRDLATQASSDTLTNQDRQALNQEYQALNQEIGRISGSTQYNTQDLLSGQSPLSDGTGTLQVGPGADGTSQLQTPNVDMSATAIGAGGDISTGAGAQSALDSVSKALDNVSAGRSRIGAMSNRLEYANRNNANMNINTTDALSRMEDLDYAQATMELARDNILSQSTMKTIQNFNQISRNTILGLLQ
jgi:flagellin